MEIAPADIAKGMEVYGTDGEQLGTVAEVYTGTPAEVEAAGAKDAADATSTLYIKVEHGGVLGMGAKDLYIPFTAVTDVAAGETLTVNGTKGECSERYGNKPDVLGT